MCGVAAIGPGETREAAAAPHRPWANAAPGQTMGRAGQAARAEGFFLPGSPPALAEKMPFLGWSGRLPLIPRTIRQELGRAPARPRVTPPTRERARAAPDPAMRSRTPRPPTLRGMSQGLAQEIPGRAAPAPLAAALAERGASGPSSWSRSSVHWGCVHPRLLCAVTPSLRRDGSSALSWWLDRLFQCPQPDVGVSRYFQVWGPTWPSTLRPLQRWTARTAKSVFSPKLPSPVSV